MYAVALKISKICLCSCFCSGVFLVGIDCHGPKVFESNPDYQMYLDWKTVSCKIGVGVNVGNTGTAVQLAC